LEVTPPLPVRLPVGTHHQVLSCICVRLFDVLDLTNWKDASGGIVLSTEKTVPMHPLFFWGSQSDQTNT